ncbi:2-C-methyl-D-erythritol 2,4-cyclodiphosphate synthase [bacterium HR17]|uniref:2-C-methyl-D-erythritol 2,4-cyclodiphosphate synthase n=1 Tax=Candidatus Fervidibacter japonicus TaxID=2035412 RepID=A0A2H5XFK8_9BACT|nr:2-C-methyl-D-erythritol 2,4-cyclodiphosphate synthase [bacterium HR17]
MQWRVGMGVDAHRFADGCPLKLCGVTIPHPRGLIGHSDADVALHALCDALLGALALGDIGQHFPDTDPRYKGADSASFVRTVLGMVRERGWQVAHVDITLVAQTPRLAPYRDAMRAQVAQLLEVPLDAVSIKATTTDGMGFVGRAEGIAAFVVATLVHP